MDSRTILESLIAGEILSELDAETFLGSVIRGDVSEIRLAAILTAIQTRRADPSELVGFARKLRSEAIRVEPKSRPLLDTCGTGGGAPSFNISTAAAIIAASCGARVAKHGNRAVTSTCGSADVLEALGVNLTLTPVDQARLIDTVGLAFLFAPAHHPAMAKVGPVRKELGIRTIFNQLGPLVNPAGAEFQVVGVFDEKLMPSMAQSLRRLGVQRGLVVHGQDGLDEVSPCAPTIAILVENDGLTAMTLESSQEGVSRGDLAPGVSPDENATILREAISDPKSPRCACVLPCAGVAVWIGGLAPSMEEGIDMARHAVADGRAVELLHEFVRETQA